MGLMQPKGTVEARGINCRISFQPKVIEPLSERSALITISDESTTSNSNSSESSDILNGDVNGDIGACNPAASFLVETLVLLNRVAMMLVFVVICFLMNGSAKHVAGVQVAIKNLNKLVVKTVNCKIL